MRWAILYKDMLILHFYARRTWKEYRAKDMSTNPTMLDGV